MKPLSIFAYLLSAVFFLSFNGAAVAGAAIVDDCEHVILEEVSAQAPKFDSVKVEVADHVQASGLHQHDTANCAAHTCAADDPNGSGGALVLRLIAAPAFSEPKDLIHLGAIYGLHRPPNA